MSGAEKDLPNPEALFLEAQPRLTFGVKAAAVGCGITVRQLDWWTRVGYIPVLQTGRHRRYSANAIKIALLVRAGLSMGMSLRRSADRARALYPFLWEGNPPAVDLVEMPAAPADELEAIREEISRISAALGDLGTRLGLALDPSQEPTDAAMVDDE